MKSCLRKVCYTFLFTFQSKRYWFLSLTSSYSVHEDLKVLNNRSTEKEDPDQSDDQKSNHSDIGKPFTNEDFLNDLQDHEFDAVASSWGSNYLMSQWIEQTTTTKHVNVAVLLPSGSDRINFKVSILPHGRLLELSINLPKPLPDMDLLHRRFFSHPEIYKIDEVASVISRFEKALKTRREHKDSNIVNTTQIFLPFKLSTDFTYHLLGWNKSSALVVYITLHFHKESYGQGNNTQAIEFS